MNDNHCRSPLWPADNPAVTAHITLIQDIITRLANCSAACKTWCLTLVAALVSLAGATHIPGIITFALVPIVIFGFLDTMYLAQETAYRRLHKTIINLIHVDGYSLENAFKASAPIESQDIRSVLKSWSIFPVYLGLIATYFISYYAGWLNMLVAPAK